MLQLESFFFMRLDFEHLCHFPGGPTLCAFIPKEVG